MGNKSVCVCLCAVQRHRGKSDDHPAVALALVWALLCGKDHQGQWLVAVQLVGQNGSGSRNYSSQVEGFWAEFPSPTPSSIYERLP